MTTETRCCEISDKYENETSYDSKSEISDDSEHETFHDSDSEVPEESGNEASDEKRDLLFAVEYGQLKEVMELSSKFTNDVNVLSEAMISSCLRGDIKKAKWFVEHTAANVNKTQSIMVHH